MSTPLMLWCMLLIVPSMNAIAGKAVWDKGGTTKCMSIAKRMSQINILICFRIYNHNSWDQVPDTRFFSSHPEKRLEIRLQLIVFHETGDSSKGCQSTFAFENGDLLLSWVKEIASSKACLALRSCSIACTCEYWKVRCKYTMPEHYDVMYHLKSNTKDC